MSSPDNSTYKNGPKVSLKDLGYMPPKGSGNGEAAVLGIFSQGSELAAEFLPMSNVDRRERKSIVQAIGIEQMWLQPTIDYKAILWTDLQLSRAENNSATQITKEVAIGRMSSWSPRRLGGEAGFMTRAKDISKNETAVSE